MEKVISLPPGYSWDNSLQQGRETSQLTALLWPPYLVGQSDIPEPGLKFEITREEFARRFPVWGVRRDSDQKLVAYLNAVLLHADLSSPELPDDGWTFAIRAAAAATPPNCLCLLAANVHPDARGLGFSRVLIERAKQAARDLGFTTVIAPVRPTLKHRFAELSMADYVAKRSDDGKAYDPWLRIHEESGGQVTNVCGNSVRIEATLPLWRRWTNHPLDRSGAYELPDGLAPLHVDIASHRGVYVEPNVWVRYAV